MKNIYKLFTGFFALVLIMDNALAEKCPAGCFCLKGGEYTAKNNADSWIKNSCHDRPAKKFKKGGTGSWMLNMCSGIKIAASRGGWTDVDFFAEDFLEFYNEDLGVYGFNQNGEFLYFDGCSDTSDGQKAYTNGGLYQCPETYPHSDAGAKALTDCYKYSANGEKEHYKVPNVSGSGNTSVSYDIEGMNTLVKNLQSALGQATKAAQDLESALNKAKQSTTKTTTSTSNSSTTTSTTSSGGSTTSSKVASASEMNASVNGLGMSYNQALSKWTANFPYGTVSGIATCNSTTGTYARAYPEYNFDNNHASSEGVNCWCRMESPNRSSWVFGSTLSSASICASDCARTCGQRVRDANTFREALFTTTQSTSSTSSSSTTTSTTSSGGSTTSSKVASASEMNASVNGLGTSYNQALSKWTVNFPYGEVSGASTCVGQGGIRSTAYPEYNWDSGMKSGTNCWCRMESPNRSSWVFDMGYDTKARCASVCPKKCSQDVNDLEPFRRGLFGTEITQSNSSTSSSSSTTTNNNNPAIKQSLTDILNKLNIKSATVPVGRAAVYDDGRNRGLTPLTGTAHDTINNRQINSRAATVVSESVGGRNARDASRNDTRTESRQIDSGRLAR